MTLKPPTRTLPRLVMKDWPEIKPIMPKGGPWYMAYGKDSLSDFTRVGEGVQERPQKEKPPSNED